MAPNNASIAPEVRNVLQRGRHYRVSFLGATQRPRDVHRVVTSQADVLCIFRQHELRDLDYVAKITSAPVASVVRELPIWTHVRYLPNVGTCEVVDKDGAVVRRVDLFDGSTERKEDETQFKESEDESEARAAGSGSEGI